MSEIKRVAKIRTSDRAAFKRCRLKWDYCSGLRKNSQTIQSRAPLWFGSGFHYAMEDFHGWNRYGDPVTAFHAYVEACRRTPLARLPDNWEELVKLGEAMLEYYQGWLSNRNHLQTYWIDGVPQVEVKFEIPLPLDPDYVKACGYDEVVYQGTIDRVCIDDKGRLWLLDWKTAKSFSTTHFDTDPQIGAYTWAGSVLFDKPIAGFVYSQHKKVIPSLPDKMKSGEYSCNKSQDTTARMYRQALINSYGDVKLAPVKNQEFLNFLRAQETSDADAYIRRDFEYRNEQQIEFEGSNILLEAQDMIRPDLPIYINATRDCTWDCDVKNICLIRQEGGDYEEEAERLLMSRDDENDNWRKYLS